MPFFVEITNLFSRSAHGSHCPGPVSEKRVAITVTPAENMMQCLTLTSSGIPLHAGISQIRADHPG